MSASGARLVNGKRGLSVPESHPWLVSLRQADKLPRPADLSGASALAGHTLALSNVVMQVIELGGIVLSRPEVRLRLAEKFRGWASAKRSARKHPGHWQGWGTGKPPAYSYAQERVFLLAARQLRAGAYASIDPQGLDHDSR